MNKLYHIIKLYADGGAEYTSSRASGRTAAEAVEDLAAREVGQRYPLVKAGDTVVVLESTSSGTIKNPNRDPAVFRVGKVETPTFTATPVRL